VTVYGIHGQSGVTTFSHWWCLVYTCTRWNVFITEYPMTNIIVLLPSVARCRVLAHDLGNGLNIHLREW